MRSHNISPLDHRYSSVIEPISQIFCQYRYYEKIYDIEIKYLEFFCENFEHIDCTDAIKKLKKYDNDVLDSILEEEKKTHHDIKAVINIIQKQLLENGHSRISHFVHFGLTSQDIVSITNNILISESLDVISKHAFDIIHDIKNVFHEDDVWCLSRTHGQVATPHKLTSDSERWYESIMRIHHDCWYHSTFNRVKFGGSTGGFVALHSLYPHVDVEELMDLFLKRMNVMRSIPTSTQTDKWDHFTDFCKNMLKNVSCMISDCQEIWHLISIGYLKLRVPETYCGSSAMPHKINPIKFENAEGCFQRCENDFQFYVEKLSKSRLHRDLSDSVVMRMVPETISYLYLALHSFSCGIKQIVVDEEAIKKDLENNYQANSEIVQLYLKMIGDDHAYEKSKSLFRCQNMCREDFKKALDELGLDIKTMENIIDWI